LVEMKLIKDLGFPHELQGLLTSHFLLLTNYQAPFTNLLLPRLRHLISHRIIQTLCLQITERITWRFEVVGELLGESLVKGGVFHVESQTLKVFPSDSRRGRQDNPAQNSAGWQKKPLGS